MGPIGPLADNLISQAIDLGLLDSHEEDEHFIGFIDGISDYDKRFPTGLTTAHHSPVSDRFKVVQIRLTIEYVPDLAILSDPQGPVGDVDVADEAPQLAQRLAPGRGLDLGQVGYKLGGEPGPVGRGVRAGLGVFQAEGQDGREEGNSCGVIPVPLRGVTQSPQAHLAHGVQVISSFRHRVPGAGEVEVQPGEHRWLSPPFRWPSQACLDFYQGAIKIA